MLVLLVHDIGFFSHLDKSKKAIASIGVGKSMRVVFVEELVVTVGTGSGFSACTSVFFEQPAKAADSNIKVRIREVFQNIVAVENPYLPYLYVPRHSKKIIIISIT